MSDVTAAGVPVRLTNGDYVIVNPWTNRDMISIFKTVQRKNLSKLVSAIPKDLDTAHYRAAYAEAVKISSEFDINNIGAAVQDMADDEVIQMMILFAIRKTYKGDAAKKAAEIMDNPDDFESVMGAINSQGQDMSEDEGEVVSEDAGNVESPPANVQP